MKTVRLITCDGAFQARLIQGALENEGIASVLHNENTSNILRGFTPTISGVDIFVYEDDYERAMALLERNQMIPEQLKYCPCCHSPHIKFVLKKFQGVHGRHIQYPGRRTSGHDALGICMQRLWGAL